MWTREGGGRKPDTEPEPKPVASASASARCPEDKPVRGQPGLGTSGWWEELVYCVVGYPLAAARQWLFNTTSTVLARQAVENLDLILTGSRCRALRPMVWILRD